MTTRRPRSDAPARQLHIVTGKGGVGKTTMAGAVAHGLARSGRRVLVCEVEDRAAIGELFDRPGPLPEETLLTRTPVGGEIHGLSITAEDALKEYLATFYRLGIAGKMLDRFGVFDFATSIAPGLGDVLVTGKVYEAVRRRQRGMKNAYDAVVLDAPPTGRIANFLNVNEAVKGLAKVGPIHKQAAAIMALLRSSKTVLHLVTVLEDMPVTETIEAVADLTPTGITPVSVICNKAVPLLSDADAALIRDGHLSIDGIDDATAAALHRQLTHAADHAHREAEHRARLQELGLALVDLDLDPGGVDRSTLSTMGDVLADSLDLEG